MDENIYIPTFRRVDEQITLNSLPGKYKENVILVVQEQELLQHKRARPEFDEKNYLVVGNDIGIAETRKIIIKHAGKSRFFIFDDDVEFYRRNIKFLMRENWVEDLFSSDMEEHGFSRTHTKRPMTVEDFDEMIEIFNYWMDNENIIQIGYRSANLPPSWHFYTDFTDVYTGYMINGAEVSKFFDNVDWTYVKVGEDSMMTLEFLLRGYKIRRSELFCIQPKWWQKGGCSEWRNAELHNKEHRKLLKHYGKEGDPRSIVYKKYDIERPNIGFIEDYRFRWKEAYRSFYAKEIGKCKTLKEALPYFKLIEGSWEQKFSNCRWEE